MSAYTRTPQFLRPAVAVLLLLSMSACIESGASNRPVRGTLVLHAADLMFDPATLNVAKPGRYAVQLINQGKLRHTVKFNDGVEVTADPGETQSVEVDVPADGLSFTCPIPGHETMMKGKIAVAGAALAATGAAVNAAHHHPMPAVAGLVKDPKAPPPPFFDATAPKLPAARHHEFDVVVEEKEMTIVPGIVQRVWTFNGSIPAPTFRVRVGDTLKVRFRNLDANKASHSLDYHASEVAANDEMRNINPGEELTMEWKANYAGVFMYHCVTSPPVHHVASGMYGMIIVEPKAGLPKADREYVIVQNEWYLGPQRGNISLEKAMASAPAPDYMAFNGIPDQYVHRPLKAKAGERLRFFVLNVGPNIESSFHIVGMVFDTVIKEGVSLKPGNEGNWGSQSVDLASAQGAIVETVAPENGLYEFVTHTFNFHDRGARGVIQVGDGTPKSNVKVTRIRKDVPETAAVPKAAPDS
jgi:nitrite reductase (NO-forming)